MERLPIRWLLIPETSSLESRIFLKYTLYVGLGCLFLVAPLNLFQDIVPVHNLFIVILGLACLVFHILARNNKALPVLQIATTMLLLDLLWLSSGGSNGSIHFYLPLLIMMTLVLLKGPKRLWLLGLQGFNVAALLFMEQAFPALILHIADPVAREIDRLSGFGLSLLLTGALVQAIISSHDRLTERFKALAVRDGLTGIFNRRFINERLEEELSLARRHGLECSVILVDIDHFKQINDQHGHQMGDEVLRHVARVMMQQLRKHDIVGRYGGEEFLIILPQTPMAGALIAAEKLRAAVASSSVGTPPVTCNLSAGLASCDGSCPPEAFSTQAILALADSRLYAAKDAGRNRCFGPAGQVPPSGVN